MWIGVSNMDSIPDTESGMLCEPWILFQYFRKCWCFVLVVCPPHTQCQQAAPVSVQCKPQQGSLESSLGIGCTDHGRVFKCRTVHSPPSTTLFSWASDSGPRAPTCSLCHKVCGVTLEVWVVLNRANWVPTLKLKPRKLKNVTHAVCLHQISASFQKLAAAIYCCSSFWVCFCCFTYLEYKGVFYKNLCILTWAH